jgi:hypothetical protein
MKPDRSRRPGHGTQPPGCQRALGHLRTGPFTRRLTFNFIPRTSQVRATLSAILVVPGVSTTTYPFRVIAAQLG